MWAGQAPHGLRAWVGICVEGQHGQHGQQGVLQALVNGGARTVVGFYQSRMEEIVILEQDAMIWIEESLTLTVMGVF